jgi:hypothetical protein
MSDYDKAWAEKRKAGLGRYLFWNGVILLGGPFAVMMQVVGVFLFREENQTFVEYFSSTRTWITFFLHATLFGLTMGWINWFRNERAFKAAVESPRE